MSSSLQRAAIYYFSSTEEYKKETKINEATLEALPTDQDRFNLVIGHYLAVHISLGRSAELLAMSHPELQIRLGRSGIPLRMGPESQEDLDNEVEIIQRSLWRK